MHYIYHHDDDGRLAVGFEVSFLYGHMYAEAISENSFCPFRDEVRKLLRKLRRER